MLNRTAQCYRTTEHSGCSTISGEPFGVLQHERVVGSDKEHRHPLASPFIELNLTAATYPDSLFRLFAARANRINRFIDNRIIYAVGAQRDSEINAADKKRIDSFDLDQLRQIRQRSCI